MGKQPVFTMTAVVLGSVMRLHAAQVTISSDLGAGNTFQTGTANSWATGDGSNSANAVSFVVPSGQEYLLSQILVADNWFAGSASLVVGFYSGSNPNSATLLESFTIPTSDATQFASTLFTLNSVQTPLLVGGNSYLIEESIPACGTASTCSNTWGWQWNNQAQTGYFAAFAGGTWFNETTLTPAFAVVGAQIPEPNYRVALFMLVALMIFRRLRADRIRSVPGACMAHSQAIWK
jgi:hypothetical protein